MAAATDNRLLLVGLAALAMAGTARADTDGGTVGEILGARLPGPRWVIEEVRVRWAFIAQNGYGYQSVDGTGDEPGREALFIWQPIQSIRIRHHDKLTHDITFPVDIVSSASADALDAVSSASKVNEAGNVDIATTYEYSADDKLTARYGVHVEEPVRGWTLGGKYERELADDNATVAISARGLFDFMDEVRPDGHTAGRTYRTTLNANLSISQLLSPTTVVSAEYGVTHQFGTLHTTWNSAPIDGMDERYPELFPRERTRHAVAARIAQHIPATRTTIKASYRYYADDFDITAHTAQVRVYQYLGPRIIVRGSYRYYDQTAAEFFGTLFPMGMSEDEPRTADSDLAPFGSDELGVKVTLYTDSAGPSWQAFQSFDLSYLRYIRSNDLSIDIVSVGFARKF